VTSREPPTVGSPVASSAREPKKKKKGAQKKKKEKKKEKIQKYGFSKFKNVNNKELVF
jgi:hypothetical protein